MSAQPRLPLCEFEVVALDLDGTLVDSAPDLAGAVNRALAAEDAPTLPEARVIAMIGDGFETLVQRALAVSRGRPPTAPEVDACAARVVAEYEQRVAARSAPYPGVRAALEALAASGFVLCCVTNKYAHLSLPLLRALDLERCFDHVLCAEHAAQRKPAPDLLDEVCRRTGAAPARVLMVGDTRDDIHAARAAGCRVAAVTYGYNSAPALADAAPDWLIDSLHTLTALASPAPRRAPTTEA